MERNMINDHITSQRKVVFVDSTGLLEAARGSEVKAATPYGVELSYDNDPNHIKLIPWGRVVELETHTMDRLIGHKSRDKPYNIPRIVGP
jgi:hypothetical protein